MITYYIKYDVAAYINLGIERALYVETIEVTHIQNKMNQPHYRDRYIGALKL
jgi:hypothetical protein